MSIAPRFGLDKALQLGGPTAETSLNADRDIRTLLIEYWELIKV